MMRPFALKLTFFVLLLLGLALGVWIGMSQQSAPPAFIAKMTDYSPFAPTPTETSPAPLPSPSPEPPQPKTSEWTSPNGKSTLVMKTTLKPGTSSQAESATYSFFVKTATEPIEHLIFSKSLTYPSTLFIPFNSWSPDNKHFYVQEKTAVGTRTFVFNATGAPFADAEPLLDIDTLFAAKDVGYNLKEVTGWAAPTLLIVNSKNATDENGPSYWFDVNRKTVTRLNTSFQ